MEYALGTLAYIFMGMLIYKLLFASVKWNINNVFFAIIIIIISWPIWIAIIFIAIVCSVVKAIFGLFFKK